MGIETQAGAALSVCADAVVGNELSVVRWHFVSKSIATISGPDIAIFIDYQNGKTRVPL